MNLTLKDILQVKGTDVRTIVATATLEEVVHSLVKHNIGSLVVCDDASEGGQARMVGIVTERDILRSCAAAVALRDVLVADVMTRDVITGTLSDRVEEISGLMTEKRVRHLPVMEQGKLEGIISIGDVVKARHDQVEMENHYLKNYIHG